MFREDQTVSQIAAASGVHPSQLHKWKRYTVDHLADLFQDQQSAAQIAAEYEQKLESLYAELGKSTGVTDLGHREIERPRARQLCRLIHPPQNLTNRLVVDTVLHDLIALLAHFHQPHIEVWRGRLGRPHDVSNGE